VLNFKIMANKITTKSYIIKRLRDMGYAVDKIETVDKLDIIPYSDSDARKWSCVIDNGGMSILLTCFKNDSLHIYDGGHYLSVHTRFKSSDVEELAKLFNERGLIRKHPKYGIRSEYSPTQVEEV